MSGKLTGIATIRVDGKEYSTEKGATLNPGGPKRTPKTSGNRVFYTEERVPPSIQATALHSEDVDIIEVGNIVNATVLFECDNGQDYMLTGAFVTDPAELNSGEGNFPLNITGRTCERV